MSLLQKIFGKPTSSKSLPPEFDASLMQQTPQPQIVIAQELPQTRECTLSHMSLFHCLPEVFFPIDYIASRIAGAHYDIKRTKDDSMVWCGRKVCDMLKRPNCLMGWREFVYTHFVNKLANGNAFVRAAMGAGAKNFAKHKFCDNFWPLPSDKVVAYPPQSTIPMYGIATEEELIDHYTITEGFTWSQMNLPAWQVWHDRDGKIDSVMGGRNYLKSKSRLDSVMKPISNLLAVYEARNVIYVKRGGIGFLVSQKQDETGTVALNNSEKKALLDQVSATYGITGGRYPFGISDVPLGFVRTNLSITELQPFEETLYDAIEIAGAYGIPAVLVPRKDQSTFSNQSTAEKSVYCGTIIPMAKQFCEDLTRWLGLGDSNIYIDCNFDDVDCLQNGRKEAEQVKKLVNDRCLSQFMAGMITLNDWRAQIHESQLDQQEMPIFSKLRWQMSDEELARVDQIISNTNNNETSTDEDEQRNEEVPGLYD